MKQYFQTIYRLWNLFKPFHKWFYLDLVAVLLIQISYVAMSFISSMTMNALVSKSIKLTIILLVAAFLLNIAENLLIYFQNWLSIEKTGFKLQQHIQQFSLKKILSLTIEQHTEDHSAMKLTIISQGENNVSSVIDTIMYQVIPAILLLIISFGALVVINFKISILVFIFFIILGAWSFYFARNQYDYIKTNRDNWNNQSKFRTEAFGHLQLVKSLGREERFIKEYINKRAEMLPHHLKTSLRNIRHFRDRSTFTTFTSSLIFSIAVYLYFNGSYSLGTIFLISSMSNRIFGNVKTLVGAMREIPQSFTHVEKYLSIIDKEPNFSEEGLRDIPLSGDISISNLTFKYPKSENPVLDDCSVIIQSGKVTAFVGHSGSGKSTIARILLRAYDYNSGSIKIGDIDLKEINAQYLREKIGYVEQHVDLFDDTVRNNILMGVRDDMREEKNLIMDDIGDKTRISEFYHRLGEAKWDTLVGERGLKLSGGERQRVGIARAIIKDPEVLIFDEATASLDSINEKFVMDAIHEVAKGRTTIIVAHRLSTVFEADKIVVLDNGKIIGEGTHDQLMQTSPKYQDLVAHQMYEHTKTTTS